MVDQEPGLTQAVTGVDEPCLVSVKVLVVTVEESIASEKVASNLVLEATFCSPSVGTTLITVGQPSKLGITCAKSTLVSWANLMVSMTPGPGPLRHPSGLVLSKYWEMVTWRQDCAVQSGQPLAGLRLKVQHRPRQLRGFWELSGGLFLCGGCGLTMHTRHTKPTGDARYFYYRCSLLARHGKGACPKHKNYPAEEVEEAVWRVVSGLLKDSHTLRVGLEEMIELERKGLRGDPDEQAKMWLSRIAEAERMRGGYQELAAKGLMTPEELGQKLAELDATKGTVE